MINDVRAFGPARPLPRHIDYSARSTPSFGIVPTRQSTICIILGPSLVRGRFKGAARRRVGASEHNKPHAPARWRTRAAFPTPARGPHRTITNLATVGSGLMNVGTGSSGPVRRGLWNIRLSPPEEYGSRQVIPPDARADIMSLPPQILRTNMKGPAYARGSCHHVQQARGDACRAVADILDSWRMEGRQPVAAPDLFREIQMRAEGMPLDRDDNPSSPDRLWIRPRMTFRNRPALYHAAVLKFSIPSSAVNCRPALKLRRRV